MIPLRQRCVMRLRSGRYWKVPPLWCDERTWSQSRFHASPPRPLNVWTHPKGHWTLDGSRPRKCERQCVCQSSASSQYLSQPRNRKLQGQIPVKDSSRLPSSSKSGYLDTEPAALVRADHPLAELTYDSEGVPELYPELIVAVVRPTDMEDVSEYDDGMVRGTLAGYGREYPRDITVLCWKSGVPESCQSGSCMTLLTWSFCRAAAKLGCPTHALSSGSLPELLPLLAILTWTREWRIT